MSARQIITPTHDVIYSICLVAYFKKDLKSSTLQNSQVAWIGLFYAMGGVQWNGWGVFPHAAPFILPDGLHDRWKKVSIGILVQNVRSLNAAVHLFSILEKARIPATAMRG